MRTLLTVLSLLIALPINAAEAPKAPATDKKACPDHFNLSVRKLHSQKEINLCEATKDKRAVLVVNTASHCGYTPQFKDLEILSKRYKSQGLVVLGFPSNAFKQEEKDELKTADICYKNYGVSFPMFSHTKIKGDDALPLFQYLSAQTQAPTWNFNKYLISKDGKVTYFNSGEKPLNAKIEKAITQELVF